MRKFLSLVVMLVATLLVGAQTAPAQEFKTVEVAVEDGWDISALDERIRAAVIKAEAPGAGVRERRGAAAALLARANLFRDQGNPRLYKFALGDLRHVLRFQPGNAGAREKADEIISIYRSLGRPVPEHGNANPDGSYTVEMFKTTPRRIEFDPGGLFKDEVPQVSSLVAHTYEFDARAGQRLNVSVSSRRGAAVLDLYREGAEGRAPLLYGTRKRAYVRLSAGKYRLRVRSRSGEVGYVLRAELK